MELNALFLPTGISTDQMPSRSNDSGNGDAFAIWMTGDELETWREVSTIDDPSDLFASLTTPSQPVAEFVIIRAVAQSELTVPAHGVDKFLEADHIVPAHELEKAHEPELPHPTHRSDIAVKSEPDKQPSTRPESRERSTLLERPKRAMPEPEIDMHEMKEPKDLVHFKVEPTPGPATGTETRRLPVTQPNKAPTERALLTRQLPSAAFTSVSANSSHEGKAIEVASKLTDKAQPAAKQWKAPEIQPFGNGISPSPGVAGEVSPPSETSLTIPLIPSLVTAPVQISGQSAPSQMQAAHSLIVAAPSDVVNIISQSLGSEEGPKERIMIQLDPPELGRVSIDFKFDAQGLQNVTITGETPDALRQLRLMHFELIQALEQRGFTGPDMTFRHQHDQPTSGTQTANDPKELHPEDQLVEKGEQINEPHHSIPGQVANNGLNITL